MVERALVGGEEGEEEERWHTNDPSASPRCETCCQESLSPPWWKTLGFLPGLASFPASDATSREPSSRGEQGSPLDGLLSVWRLRLRAVTAEEEAGVSVQAFPDEQSCWRISTGIWAECFENGLGGTSV